MAYNNGVDTHLYAAVYSRRTGKLVRVYQHVGHAERKVAQCPKEYFYVFVQLCGV